MRPRSANGRNKAERAPTTTGASPLCDRRPDAFALALRQAGVPFGRSCAETRGEAVEKLRGQRNLRQQHQRLALLPKRFGDRLEINLGLARSGHALEQGGRERAVGDEPDQIVGRGALIGVEADGAEIRIERGHPRLRRERDRLERAVGDKTVDDAGRAGGARGERGFGRGRARFR